ncbi:MAG: glycosyltransferase, partial [Bacteroidia bacterium]|nr:glycosyltransferase [Bacteroidia bacterium]
PSYLWKLDKPFVWGPVGHHPEIPAEYLQSYKKAYLIKDRLTLAIKKAFWNMSRSLNQTTKRAAHIFCMNKSVPQVLNLNGKYSITPSVATQDFGFDLQHKGEKFTIITAGRLVPLKGFDMTIKSFAGFLAMQPPGSKASCELVIVGSGPELTNYKNMTRDLGIEQHVQFIDWISRENLMDLFKKSSLFVFPSHEGAGMVVAEALSFGLPVVCLDNCGPGEFIDEGCGIKVSYENYNQTIKEISIAITDLFNSPELLKRMSMNARAHFESYFHWDIRGEAFRKVYLNL